MRFASVLIGFAIIIYCTSSEADNWPQFRGASQDYTFPAEDIPTSWSDTTNIRWKVPIEGRGWASPVVWENKIFVATAIKEVEGKDTAPPPDYRSGRVGKESIYRWELHCIDRESGEELWKKIVFRGNPGVRTHPQNTYASETPTTDGTHVYVYFGMVGLFCYDMDGNLVWKKNLGQYKMLGDWGTSTSPILYESRLYIQIDNEDECFLLALEPANGEQLWKVERPKGSSWSTPYIWKNNVRTELVTNAEDVRGYNPATGELLWTLAYPGGRASSSPTGNADVLIVGNERRNDGGGVMYAVKAGASGDISPVAPASTSKGVLWSTSEASPEFGSPLLYNGNVYLFGRNRGYTGAFNVMTGDLVEGINRLPKARSFWSSPWAYEGHIYCFDEGGTAFVLSAAPEIEFITTHALGEIVRASPAILEGTMFVRTENHLVCLGN